MKNLPVHQFLKKCVNSYTSYIEKIWLRSYFYLEFCLNLMMHYIKIVSWTVIIQNVYLWSVFNGMPTTDLNGLIKECNVLTVGFFFSLVQSESVQTADDDRVGQQVHLPGAQGPELGEGEARAGQQLHAQVQELLPGETGTND